MATIHGGRGRTQAVLVVTGLLQAWVIIFFCYSGRIDEHIRNMTMIYLTVDLLALAFRRKFNEFRSTSLRCVFYFLAVVAVFFTYLLIAKALRMWST